MTDNPGAIEDEEAPIVEDDAAEISLKANLALLKSRCEAANIGFDSNEDPEFGVSAQVSLPAGKAVRRVGIMSLSRAEALLSIEFEKFRFLPGYDAIWSPTDNSIEAALQTTRLNADSLVRRVSGIAFNAPITDDSVIRLQPPEHSNKPRMEIGPTGEEFSKLLGFRAGRISLKLTDVRAKTSEHALRELTSFSNSLFFQLDLIYGYSFILGRERRASIVPLSKKMRRGLSIEYPTTNFNNDAISLYWYGKSARGMPLLQYLAFYQCIEFYFPRYSQLEARKRVSSLLKRPTFRPNRDDDLDAVISAVQLARSGGFGSERNQLRSVINECISAEEVRDYLQSDKERFEHFSGKAKNKFHKVPITNKLADLRNDVADRIYDIRCKIVHTKNDESEDDLKMILPFSEDADYLIQDVELVEFVSRSVLSSSSSDLE